MHRSRSSNMFNVSYVLIVVFSALVTCQAHCTGGQAPPGARVIYQATRRISQVGTGNVICSLNGCHLLNYNINRVDISGSNWSCRDGGPGSFKVVINVGGGDSRNFTATVWATGKDVGQVTDPHNSYNWACILESRASGCA